MTWSISTINLKSVHSFEQAQNVWTKAPPWKNHPSAWRPLDGPRMPHKRLVFVRNNGVEGYECTLYETALVTYYADGSVALRTHGSVSSGMFTDCVRPPGCSLIRHVGDVYWKVTTDAGEHYYAQHRDPLRLTRTDAGNWLLRGEPAHRSEWISNPAKVREVGRQIKPYKDWFDTTSRLLGIQPQRVWLPGDDDVRKILAQQPSAFRKAFEQGVTPETIRTLAYKITGAKTVQPVSSYDYLPRNPA